MDVDAGSGVGNGDSGNSGRHQRIVTLRLAAYQAIYGIVVKFVSHGHGFNDMISSSNKIYVDPT